MNRDNAYLIGNKLAVGNGPNKTSFQKGLIPWNKGKTGWSAVGTERTRFKAGVKPVSWVPVGTVKIRQRKNRKESPRAFIKVAEPNVWRMRAVVVWESVHGELPAGFVVHHEDRDPLNDSPGNLVAMTRGEHLLEHRKEFEEKRKSAASQAATKRHRRNRLLKNSWHQLMFWEVP